jgi:hypothetical protein
MPASHAHREENVASDDPREQAPAGRSVRQAARDVPIRNPAVIRRPQEGGWSVLVNLDNVRSVALNPTADLTWRALDGQHGVHQVVDLMRRSFTEVPPSVMQDVTALLEELAESGFIGYEVVTRRG